MGSIMSGKGTQPNNNKTSGGALAAIAVIQRRETAGLSWWQPVIHRPQQGAGFGHLQGGKPWKGQAWWMAACRLLVAQVCLGSCGVWREVVAGQVGISPHSAPWLHQPIAEALWGEWRVLSSPLGDKQGTKHFPKVPLGQDSLSSYHFHLEKGGAWLWIQTPWLAPMQLASDVHCTELMVPRAPRAFQTGSWLLHPHYSWVISCTTPPLWRGLNAETKQTKTTKQNKQENHFSCHSKPKHSFLQAHSSVRGSSKPVFPQMWVLCCIATSREKVPAVVLCSHSDDQCLTSFSCPLILTPTVLVFLALA